jgi:hypothetical protein
VYQWKRRGVPCQGEGIMTINTKAGGQYARIQGTGRHRIGLAPLRKTTLTLNDCGRRFKGA